MGTIVHTGILFVVSSPSGAGKTTLCRKLLAEFDNLHFSVSVTTRRPRPGERDGMDYTFVTPAAFQKTITTGGFAEWAQVHDHHYGTPKEEVTQALEQGHDVLFDIDWQGGRQLRHHFPDDTLLVWILPPSLEALRDRLQQRAADSKETIQRRLAAAHDELAHFVLYDYLVVNDNLDAAYQKLRAIYIAAHWEQKRARHHADTLLVTLDGSKL